MHPNILVISPHHNNVEIGSSILVKKLLHKWPNSNMYFVYNIKENDLKRDLPLKHYYVTQRPMSPFKGDLWFRIRQYQNSKIESVNGIFFSRLSDDLEEWLDLTRPNIIYSHLGSIHMTHLSLLIADFCQVPLVVHIMDDYIVNWPPKKNWVLQIPFIKRRLSSINKKLFKKALDYSSMRMVISPSMSQEYHRRYKHAFEIFHNGVLVNQSCEKLQSQKDLKSLSELKVVFLGSILDTTNLEAIMLFVEEIKNWNQNGETRFSITLDIFSTNISKSYNIDDSNVIIKPSIPLEEVNSVLLEYDLLLLPISFSKDTLEFVKYSLPTKLADYLKSGVPILYYGPDNGSIYSFLSENKCAFLCVRDDTRNLEDFFKQYSDTILYYNIVENASLTVNQLFNIEEIQDRFYRRLIEVATEGIDDSNSNNKNRV